MDLGKCMRSLNITNGKSIDEKGRERFHSLPLKQSFYGPRPNEVDLYAENEFKLVRKRREQKLNFISGSIVIYIQTINIF